MYIDVAIIEKRKITKDDLKYAEAFEVGAGLSGWEGSKNKEGKWFIYGIDSPRGHYDIKFRSVIQMINAINDEFMSKKNGWIKIFNKPSMKARKTTTRKTVKKPAYNKLRATTTTIKLVKCSTLTPSEKKSVVSKIYKLLEKLTPTVLRKRISTSQFPVSMWDEVTSSISVLR